MKPMGSLSPLRLVNIGLLLVGLMTLLSIMAYIGPSKIYDVGANLGPIAIALMLVPSTVMYVLDGLGWRFTLAQYQTAVPFVRLLMVRTAGEFLNTATPTASVGGEPLKAALLKTFSVPMGDGLASVIVAKTTMTLAQIMYIFLGLALWLFLLEDSPQSRGLSHWAMAGTAALLLFSTGLFVVLQQRGLFAVLFAVVDKFPFRMGFLADRREELRSLDALIAGFYRHRRALFAWSAITFFGGWLMEAAEVYVMLRYLGQPIEVVTAVSIDALCTLIKGGAFFIPGSVGVQEGGIVLLLKAFGYSDVTGISFALLRRLRELVWMAVGVACFALLSRGAAAQGAEGA
ncbi:MAG: flippase-like domain-containing protein [Nitrospira sp. CR1.1]|nr:flippase-like domain-containing protein [Nitrospira sp. CR1.1]